MATLNYTTTSAMKSLPLTLSVLFIIVLETVECSKSPEFVYQEDMSEYCQRRVISSVFLGRRVMKANSQIMHFSAMEVPYTCAISIRAEPGSNIVFVIEMKNITDACNTSVPNMSQVMVYELGETFGGYWGLLPPDFLTSYAPTKGKYHTIHTTKSEKPTESGDTDSEDYLDKTIADIPYEDLVGETTRRDQKQGSQDSKSYITVEVPLVNVSGVMVDSDSVTTKQENTSEVDDTFDILYDVAPKPGEEYSTTVLPLVQFSIYPEHYRRSDEGNTTNEDTYNTDHDHVIDDGTYVSNETKEEGSRYALDYEIFTPDPRLKYPFLEHILSGKAGKIHKKQKFNANKMLKFRQQTPWFRGRSTSKHYPDHTMEMRTEKPFPTIKIGNDSIDNPSKYIEELMAALRASKGQEQSELEQDDNLQSSKLLRKIADMNHNFSAYLVQNESMYNNLPMSDQFRELELTVTKTATTSTKNLVTKHNSYTHKLLHEKALTNSTQRIPETNNKQSLLNLKSTNMADKSQHLEKSARALSSETKKDIVIQTTIAKSSTLHLTTKATQSSTKTTTMNSGKLNDKIRKVSNSERRPILNDKEKKTTEKPSTKASASVTTPKTMTDSAFSKKQKQSGHSQLVNHESWENIVQAAPALAGALNKNNPVETEAKTKHVNRVKRRRKRFIQAIDIEVAQPRNVTMRPTTRTTPADMFYFTDRQDFAQLVELEDDDMYGRMALRNMRSYTSALLLDVCKIKKQKSRQVFVFNTSRILLTINDFTVQRMTIVVTPARTLTTQDSRCPDIHLECQVLGARVCIDRMVACDGVPNCGTYDIYDEDRLLCSMDHGVQHNVYMAAFAFLAVLMTALYTVHYWLRRCVPKVSDAFFIYTDGTENILYLDTIMRSPTADHDGEHLLHGHQYMGGMMEDMLSAGSGHNTSKFTKFKNFFRHFGKKHQETALDLSLEELDLNLDLLTSSRRQPMYSFAECEINTIVPHMLDETTQTGESLQMRFLKGETESKGEGKLEEQRPMETKNQERKRTMEIGKILKLKDASVSMVDEEKSKDSELSMLKFMKDNRTAGRRGTILPDIPEDVNPRLRLLRSVGVGDEKEIQSTIYDTDSKSKLPRDSLSSDLPIVSSSSYSDTLKPSTSKQTRKQLRFNDNLTTISSSDEVDDEITKHRQSTMLGSVKNTDLEEYHEHSAARDFKRFWSTNKGAKKQTPPKKKSKSTFR